MTQPATQRHLAKNLTSEFLGQHLVVRHENGSLVVAPINSITHEGVGSRGIVSITVRVNGTNATGNYDYLGYDYGAEQQVEIGSPLPHF